MDSENVESAALGLADILLPVVLRTVLVQHPKIPLVVLGSMKRSAKVALESRVKAVKVVMETSLVETME